jgi:hypothetical protein
MNMLPWNPPFSFTLLSLKQDYHRWGKNRSALKSKKNLLCPNITVFNSEAILDQDLQQPP